MILSMLFVAKILMLWYYNFVRICNLASGSSGNCTYVETDFTRILIDCGKPFSYIFNALNEINVDAATIEAILITHEHSDHIKGIQQFAKTYNTPIYAHIKLCEVVQHQIHVDKSLFNFFEGEFEIKNLKIFPFDLPHDSIHCVGYRVSEEDAVMSICTDLGSFSENTYQAIKSSALVFLEANYDPEMLMSCSSYPPFLKRRINGQNGHLSNLNCAKAIEQLVRSGTRLIVLSHISEHSNTVNLAVGTIAGYLESKGIQPNVNVRLDVAHHERRGTIFKITPTSKKNCN